MSNSELQQRIKRQVEYYFDDENTERVFTANGWVSIRTVLRCNSSLALICSNLNVIRQALKSSDLIDISNDGTKVRISDLNLGRKIEQRRRTAYVFGFSRDSDIDELIQHFKTAYPVEHVIINKEKGKNAFKGSVYLRFKTPYDEQKFSRSNIFYKNYILETMSYYMANPIAAIELTHIMQGG